MPGKDLRVAINTCKPMRLSTQTVKFFSKSNHFIFGYFDPTNIFSDNKNKYLLG